jgi:hypothetical protein
MEKIAAKEYYLRYGVWPKGWSAPNNPTIAYAPLPAADKMPLVNKSFTYVQAVCGVKKWPLPEFARYQLKINFLNGSNPDGYSIFYSIDWSKRYGCVNEYQGRENLLNLIWYKYAGKFREATIYANYTDDLRVKNDDGSWRKSYTVKCFNVIGGSKLNEYEYRIAQAFMRNNAGGVVLDLAKSNGMRA